MQINTINGNIHRILMLMGTTGLRHRAGYQMFETTHPPVLVAVRSLSTIQDGCQSTDSLGRAPRSILVERLNRIARNIPLPHHPAHPATWPIMAHLSLDLLVKQSANMSFGHLRVFHNRAHRLQGRNGLKYVRRLVGRLTRPPRRSGPGLRQVPRRHPLLHHHDANHTVVASM